MAQDDVTKEEVTIHGYFDVVGEGEYGRKISPGDTLIINAVNIVNGQYGEIAVFETTEGKRYSGATAIVSFATKLIVKPELLPVKVGVGVAVSGAGRRYITFVPV